MRETERAVMRLSFLLLLFVPGVAMAQGQAPPERSPFTGAAAPPAAPAPALASAEPSETPVKGSGPKARTGFQMHLVPMAAIAFPVLDATDEPGDSLSARYGWQWMPFEIGLGGKIIEPLYIGGYLNVAVGSEGDDRHTERHCESGNDVSDDVSCSGTSVHLGLELRYAFTPADSLSGWVGYGFGYTAGVQTISDEGRYSETSTAQGFELARLSGGLDVRAARGFGFGPFAVISVGRYVHRRTTINNDVTFSGEIEEPTQHAWLSAGLRLVFFP